MPAKAAARTAAPRTRVAAKKSPAEDVVVALDAKDMVSSLTADVVEGEASPNVAYVTRVQAAFNVVKEQLPEVFNVPALPMIATSDDAPEPRTGFGEPFNPATFQQNFDDLTHLRGVACHIPFTSVDLFATMTPYIPLNENRVRQLIPLHFSVPAVFPFELPIAIDWDKTVEALPTSMMTILPLELLHALVFQLEQRLPGCSAAEKIEWKRMLLSVPARLYRMDKGDIRYAEAMNWRARVVGTATVVRLTLRQVVYNIQGFKVRKEATSGPQSAAKIADFHKQFCIDTPGEPVMSRGAIDTALTLHARVFALPRCEQIFSEIEERFGADHCLNQPTVVQELVYRARNPARIEWMLESIWDGMQQGTLDPHAITNTNIKAQTKNSIGDVMIQQKKLRDYLTSDWLDSIDLRSDVKAKLRDIFTSVKSYRTMYNPGNVTGVASHELDRTFLFNWGPAAIETLNLFELCIFSDNQQVEFMLRMAVRQGKDAAETLAMKPFCDKLNEIKDLLKPPPPTPGAGSAAGGGGHPVSDSGNAGGTASVGEEGSNIGGGENVNDSDDDNAPPNVNGNANIQSTHIEHVDRMMRNQYSSVLDQKTESKLAEALKGHPLATVAGTPQSGNVLIHMDCNSWGEAGSNPQFRKPPMGKDLFKRVYNGVKMARYDMESGADHKLQSGDIYSFIDGNKDRRRLFHNAVKSKSTGKDKDKLRKLVLHCSENSVKSRKKKARRVTCTQGLFICHSGSTDVPHRDYKILAGSNRCDMFGPLELDTLQSLETLEKREKAAWWGKDRIIEVGGPMSESEGGADDDSEVEGAEDIATVTDNGKLPINYHQLPATALHELAWAFNAKHIIDLSPSPALAAVKLLEDGCSYFAVVPTKAAQDWFYNHIRERLLKQCATPGTKLHSAVSKAVQGDIMILNNPAPMAGTLSQTGTPSGANLGEPSATGEPPKKRQRRGANAATGSAIATPARAAADGTGTPAPAAGAPASGGQLDIGKLLAEAKAKLGKPAPGAGSAAGSAAGAPSQEGDGAGAGGAAAVDE